MVSSAGELSIEFDACLKLTRIVDVEFTSVVVLIHFRGMKGGEHVVLVCGHILIEGGDDVVPPIDREIVLWKLTRKVCLFVEGIGKLSFPIDIVCLGAVCHITIGKEVRGEVGGGESGGSETESIVVIG